MMLRSFCIVAALLANDGAAAQAYLSFGAGNDSCATWLNNPVKERLGEEFVAGLWTGLNMADRLGSHFVGKSTDSQGKVAEVKKLCLDRPSMALVDAASEVWTEFRRRGL